ncbi:hypothetical protein B0H11DRAFT_2240695 [Mycena galericulata]|nr:hypothetical protein B0H11DRAFT_2240695 [Mycena galericulata]
MNYTIDPAEFTDVWDSALQEAYGTCVEVLLYGILLVLLSVAAYLLYHRTGAGRRIFAVATALTAILATVQLAVRLRATEVAFLILRLAVQGETQPQSASAVQSAKILFTVSDALLTANNVVTDSLFIYRCFVVWNNNVRVVVLPALLLLATTVLGCVITYKNDTSGRFDVRTPFILSLVTNLVLTFLMAGRIWWIRRGVTTHLESAYAGSYHARTYDTVIAIILESGAIYCISGLVYVVVVSVWDPHKNTDSMAFTDQRLGRRPPQIINIAPLLIIVRVGLERTVDKPGTTVQRTDGSRPFPHGGARRAMPVSTFEIRVSRSEATTDEGDTGQDVSLEELGKQI